MAKIKIPGVSASEGMRQMNFVFPPGEYLLKITGVEVTDKTNLEDVVVGQTFQIQGEVLGGENLPSSENVKDYVGRTYTDFIFVMTPDHPSYAKETKTGGTVGEIGLGSLKSFLDAAGVAIKNDEFDEKKAINKWIEIRCGTRKWNDNDGNERTGNQVYEYRPHVDEEKEAAATPDAVVFEDDDIV